MVFSSKKLVDDLDENTKAIALLKSRRLRRDCKSARLELSRKK